LLHPAAAAAADLSYNQEPMDVVGALTFPGKMHEGFTYLANLLWQQGLREALTSQVLKGSVTSVTVVGHSMTSVTVVGHSMGGSVATLLSCAAQVREDADA
jgi:hypothetical protein